MRLNQTGEYAHLGCRAKHRNRVILGTPESPQSTNLVFSTAATRNYGDEVTEQLIFRANDRKALQS